MIRSTLKPRIRSGALKAAVILISGLAPLSTNLQAAKQMEYLDRGVVAVQSGNGVFLSWRMLGDDPAGVGFHVYRDGARVTTSPITDSTNFHDAQGSGFSSYSVRAVVNGREAGDSLAGAVWSDNVHSIALRRPAGGRTPDGVDYDYSPNDASVGDLDGDGDYEYLVKWYPSNAKDNSQSGYTGNTYLDAYEWDGTFLWRIDLGRNIRSGAHYTQFIVYDLDGDGKAEVAVKTADGSKDAQGEVIGNANADYRNSSGYVLSGPEYLSLFDGESGRELATTNYVPARGNVSSWGDNYGNRVDRFLAGVAYLDGASPSLIMSRGYYTRTVVAAWDWRDGRLSQRWVFDSNNSGNGSYAGQGAHSLTVGDVDSDGRDEIVFGAATIDDNGRGLYSTRLGVGDALHLGDLNPNRPGMEVYMVHESPSVYGAHGVEMHDARTGAILWSRDGNGEDVGRGVSMDIDPRYPGNESWASRNGLVAADGRQISSGRPSQMNFGVYWDGDLLRELLDGETIDKWNYASGNTSRLLTAYNSGAASNNGSKKTPALSADILGDWREEVIWRHSNNRELLVFTSTIPTVHRIRTLMHDPQYRVAVAWQNVGYNQPPHTSFFLGDGMRAPAMPNIYFVGDNPNGDGPVEPPAPEPPKSGPVADGTYALVSRFNGKALTVAGGSSASGADIVQWGAGESAGQSWELKHLGNGDYSIIASHSGKSLDVLEFSLENGANIIQWDATGADNQIWNLQEVDSGYFVVTSALSGKALDIYGFSGEDGASVVQWENLYGENQQWRFDVAGSDGEEPVDEPDDPVEEPVDEPQQSTLTIEENQPGFCSVDGAVSSSFFSSASYANTDNAAGAGIEWSVNAAQAGDVQLSVRYAASGERPAQLLLNDSVVTAMPFASTGSWLRWNKASASVQLNAGLNRIRIEATGREGLALVDNFSISGTDVTPADCN